MEVLPIDAYSVRKLVGSFPKKKKLKKRKYLTTPTKIMIMTGGPNFILL